MPLALEIGDLHVEYGGASALTGVTLAAEQGRVTGITGNNGAGKTTLLHAVMGLVKPRQGSVRVLGDVVTGQAPAEWSREALRSSLRDATCSRTRRSPTICAWGTCAAD